MDTTLPAYGTKVKCLDNTDRPELTVGQIYTVSFSPCLDKAPINYARHQPEDWRLFAVKMPGQTELGIYPYGLFVAVE
jgi:hypothetical protein